MKINEVIRKYRKEQHLTQEQVANYLGVTPPAVNKWESGISYPDITLLAPLARFLNIDVDTLLSFHDELTDMEISNIIKDLSTETSTLGYAISFQKASDLIKAYPNCNKLILYSAQILNAYLATAEVEDKDKYEKQIKAWFEKIALCEDKELANMAAVSLCQNYMSEGHYDKAQDLLDKIPPLGFDKRIVQANLLSVQEQYDKAYEIHETMLYQGANALIGTLMQIIQTLCKQKDYENALMFARLSRVVAEHFDLGKYIAASSEFMIALTMQDKAKSLLLFEEMINDMTFNCIKESRLYQHTLFKNNTDPRLFKEMLKKSFEKDESLDFIRNDPEFLVLMKKLCND